MQIVINIPKEFERHFNQDRFEDSLYRLSADAHLNAGNYEQETATMLISAFKDGVRLPKNHGSLKDTDSIIADIYDKYMSSDMKIYNEDAKRCIKMISEAHTVLEAESEVSDAASPKGHKRLIEDDFEVGPVFDEEGCRVGYKYITQEVLSNAPTIIEADKESKE